MPKRKIELKQKTVQHIFEVEYKAYFYTKKFEKILNIEGAEVSQSSEYLMDGSTVDYLIITYSGYIPPPETGMDAWEQYWREHEEEENRRENDARLECEKMLDDAFWEDTLLVNFETDKQSIAQAIMYAQGNIEDGHKYFKEKDYGMSRMSLNDAKSMLDIAKAVNRRDRKAALEASSGLDTAVREAVPCKMWDWIHFDPEGEPEL